MTKDEWELVRGKLSVSFGLVDLIVDGYLLHLKVQQTGPLKYEILPYVNGKFEGRWITQKTDECIRFMCPKTVSLYSRADKARITKGLTKRQVKDFFPDLDKTGTYYQWGWASFTSLKRHLLANNKSIELKKEA